MTPSLKAGELSLSVWATAQTSTAAQRKDRYVPESAEWTTKVHLRRE
ncbi:hypothetical protein AB0F52_09650 [Amycolatopsis sp. NPDC024027]